MVDFKSLGHNIRKYRVEAALSQDELAERADAAAVTLGKLKTGNLCPA